MPRRLPSIALSLLLGSCLDPPAVPGPSPSTVGEGDAAVMPGEGGLVVTLRGEDGRPLPSSAAPRRPVLVVEGGASLRGQPEPVLLFEGRADTALLDDLERPPLQIAHIARRVPLRIERDERGVTARPEAPLDLGATYTFAVAAWAEGADGLGLPGVTALPFTVARSAAGAILAEIFPPAASAGVDPALPLVAVRFDDLVTGAPGLALEEADGTRIDCGVATAPCADLGFPPGHCVTLSPAEPLAPSTEHRIRVPASILDRTGASVGPVEVGFTTGEGPAPPIVLTAPSCGVDERALESTCTLSQDTSVRVVARASGPVRAFLELGASRVGTVAPRGEVGLVVTGLPPDTSFEAVLRLVDVSGRVTTTRLPLSTHPSLAPIAITEIRADARGPEPAQEYVELLNLSDRPLDLGGYRLADRADSVGDPFPVPSWLPARGRALVVADAFDPAGAEDPPVAPGIPLFRIGSSLGTSGLSNAGEPLFLRDAMGRRLAEAPALAAPGAGHCIVRRAGTERLPADGDYGPAPDATCTPGLP